MEDLEGIQIVNLIPEVIDGSILLLENNQLKLLDALHISCALKWKTELFISSDKRQTQTAENSGLEVRYIQ